MKIADVILPRIVETGGASFEVRSPTVREALVIFFAAPEAMTGDSDSLSLIDATLRSWYPHGLYSRIKKEPVENMIRGALLIINDGVEDLEKAKRKSAKEIEWEDAIASFMSAYGYAFDDVLSMSWSSFLMLMKQIPRLSALRKLETLHVQSIPNISDNFERQGAVMELRVQAGYKPVTEIDDETALQNLKTLQAEMAMFTGPTPQGEA